MKGHSRRPSGPVMRARWVRWTATVELFANRRSARHRVRLESYATLHRELIAACRSSAASADEENRAYFEGLERLVTPWLSPKTLARADGEIIASLLARCREVEREIGGRRGSPSLARIARISLLVVGFVGCFVLLTWVAVDWDTLVGRVRDWSDVIRLGAMRLSDSQKLGIAAVVVVLISVRLLSRTSRS